MAKVPDRWFDYSSYGSAVANIFVALKVPLASKFLVPDNERFTPQDAMANLPVGLIVDLTNTKRYYDPNEFTREGIDYRKLFVQGHVVPSFETVQRFIDIVNEYLQGSSGKGGKLVGVHCTHGLNRTGYLVCAYLILELGYEATDAIALFNMRRGHHMERNNYLMSLSSLRKAPVRQWKPEMQQQQYYQKQEQQQQQQPYYQQQEQPYYQQQKRQQQVQPYYQKQQRQQQQQPYYQQQEQPYYQKQQRQQQQQQQYYQQQQRQQQQPYYQQQHRQQQQQQYYQQPQHQQPQEQQRQQKRPRQKEPQVQQQKVQKRDQVKLAIDSSSSENDSSNLSCRNPAKTISMRIPAGRYIGVAKRTVFE